jgi:hypothetical protein
MTCFLVRRFSIAYELYETEKNYIEGLYRSIKYLLIPLYEHHIKRTGKMRLMEGGKISEWNHIELYEEIFNRFDDILTHHLRIATKLLQKLKRWTYYSSLSDIFEYFEVKHMFIFSCSV